MTKLLWLPSVNASTCVGSQIMLVVSGCALALCQAAEHHLLRTREEATEFDRIGLESTNRVCVMVISDEAGPGRLEYDIA